jgi:hypothetical protein
VRLNRRVFDVVAARLERRPRLYFKRALVTIGI